MKRTSLFRIFAVVLLGVLCLGCGGNAGMPDSNKPATSVFTLVPQAVGSYDIEARPAKLVNDPNLPVDEAPPASIAPGYTGLTAGSGHIASLTGLPPLPVSAEPTPMFANRTASGLHTIDLDNPFQDGGSTGYPAGNVILGSTASDICYAIYRLDLQVTERADLVNLSGSMSVVSPTNTRPGVYIGYSNYAKGCWYFPDKQENPPCTYDCPINIDGDVVLDIPSGTYKDANNFMYIILVTYGGDSAWITDMSVTTTGDVASFLPPEWYTVVANAGLGTKAKGFKEIFPDDIPYPGFAWTGYDDMYTTMPVYWSAWYGDPGAAYPHLGEPDKFPEYTRDKSSRLRNLDSLQDMLLEANSDFVSDHQIGRQTHTEELNATDPLAHAIADFVEAAGGTADLESYITQLDAMSDQDQAAIAPILYAALQALQIRITNMPFDAASLELLFNWTHGSPSGQEMLRTEQVLNIYDTSVSAANDNLLLRFGMPYGALFTGAGLITDAIDDFSDYIATPTTFANVNLNVDTAVGRITIGGTGNDTHEAPLDGTGHVLLIDLGGNDTYNCHAGGTASINNGVSICIDVQGEDVYNRLDDPDDVDRTAVACNDNTSQQGAGRYGIGILVDYAGDDDEYHAVRLSQGSCVMGVGMLVDMGGDDIYEAEALCQGGAFGGIAILYDGDGIDEYSAWRNSQGFGGPMGIGYLLDHGDGADIYYAEVMGDAAKPEYYITGTYNDRNINNCQGAAWGWRWGWLPASNDGSTGTVASGGQGLLFDGGGDDTYTCGVFGQGSGFYQGLGMLIDDGGSDSHTGHWYTTGATAHAAAAALWDKDGNDTYDNEVSVGIGGAHDWSLTWFVDRNGADTYEASTLSLGTGYSNGFAYFLDFTGDDIYNASYCNGAFESLGRGNLGDADRQTQPTYGLFLDAGGTDTYDVEYAGMLTGQDAAGVDIVPNPPADGATWIRDNGHIDAGHGFYPLGTGSGLDSGTAD